MSDGIDYDRLAGTLSAVLERREKASPTNHIGATQVEEIARRAAKEAVEAAVPIAVASTLINFGLDPSDRQNIQRDMLFIRDMRTLSADSKKHILLAVLGILTTGVVSAVWLYLKSTGKAG